MIIPDLELMGKIKSAFAIAHFGGIGGMIVAGFR